MNIFPQTTIIIDALDECDPNDRWMLLDLLEDIIRVPESLTKVFVSSRDDLDIKLLLQNVPNLFIQAKDNGVDIKRYIDREITRRKKFLDSISSDGLKDEICSELLSKANGM